MNKRLTIVFIAAVALVLSAVPAAGQEPFPPADWEHTARFSGDHLYAYFEWMSGESAGLTIEAYDGAFKSAGKKGKGTANQLVSARFEASDCDADGVMVYRTFVGSTFRPGVDPVYDAETHAVHAVITMGGHEWQYRTVDCSWASRVLLAGSDITATLTIDGHFVTQRCRGKCYAVCEFVGSISLQHGATDLLEGKQFDTVLDGQGAHHAGEISWWAPPDGWPASG